jgi:hypothetical protein
MHNTLSLIFPHIFFGAAFFACGGFFGAPKKPAAAKKAAQAKKAAPFLTEVIGYCQTIT